MGCPRAEYRNWGAPGRKKKVQELKSVDVLNEVKFFCLKVYNYSMRASCSFWNWEVRALKKSGVNTWSYTCKISVEGGFGEDLIFV